jgi:hypothetical protein
MVNVVVTQSCKSKLAVTILRRFFVLYYTIRPCDGSFNTRLTKYGLATHVTRVSKSYSALSDMEGESGRHCIRTASESSPDRELATIRNSSSNEPRQSQLPQRSVGSPGVSVEQSGPRRSARLAGAHLPPDLSTSAPLRRSARLTPTRRR